MYRDYSSTDEHASLWDQTERRVGNIDDTTSRSSIQRVLPLVEGCTGTIPVMVKGHLCTWGAKQVTQIRFHTSTMLSQRLCQSSFSRIAQRLPAAGLAMMLVMVHVRRQGLFVPKGQSFDKLPQAFSAACTWSPSAADECTSVLTSRVCHNQQMDRASRRRFLIMGDSTAGPDYLSKYLYNFTIQDASLSLQAAYGDHYHCETRQGSRCNNNELFDLSYPDAWVPPNYTLGEGPVALGARQAFCSDCAGCDSVFLVCSVNNNATRIERSTRQLFDAPLLYGGFFKAEFVRDVELQSPQFLTSQENIAQYIKEAYNTPDLLEDWRDRPICLLSSSHHDVLIPGMTQDMYVTNIEWYIRVMQPQCHFIIWIGANLPAGEVNGRRYPQTPERTTAWNTAARQLIENTSDLNAVFVDVLNASHFEGSLSAGDNVHMEPVWYETLATFFIGVLSTKCQP